MMHPKPEQTAWRILLSAFVIFLLLCSSAFYLAQWFVFQSTVPMTVEVHASRGTAGVSPQNVEEAEYIDRYKLLNRNDLPITLRTDSTSQVVVSFTDPQTNVLV